MPQDPTGCARYNPPMPLETPSSSPSNPRHTTDARGPIAFVLGGVVGASIFAIASLGQQNRGMDEDLSFYREVRDLVGTEFVQERTREELLVSAVEGIVADLDVYSRFYSGDELARIERATSGTFLGLGAIFAPPISKGQLLFPMPDSPAQRSGLGVGERILSVDGKPLAGMGEGEFEALLGHLDGTPLALVVESVAGEQRTLQIEPESIADPTVRHGKMLDDSVGYLAITSFSRRTLEEFDIEVGQLIAEGMSELVIDLRNNPGGVLRIALGIANRFIDEGPLLYTDSRAGREETTADESEAHHLGMPLVVLIDGDSASSSEVLAGTLQDHRVAVIVGTPSYGKGTVQTLTTLGAPHSILKVTTAFYTTPSGRQIDRHYSGDQDAAITPDLLVPLEPAAVQDIRAQLSSYSPPRIYRAAVADLLAGSSSTHADSTASALNDRQLASAHQLIRSKIVAPLTDQ